MASSNTSTRTVPNLTDFCYSENGSYLVACTKDGFIYIFENEVHQGERFHWFNQCSSIILHNNHTIIGGTTKAIEARKFPDGGLCFNVVPLTQQVSTFHLSNNLLFVGTTDFKVLMIKLNNKSSNNIVYFPSHNASIVSLSAYVEKQLLGIACANGGIHIVRIDTQQCVQNFQVYEDLVGRELFLPVLRFDWNKIDEFFAIPIDNSVQFYSIDQWEQKGKFQNNLISDMINQISFNSSYLMFVVGYTNGIVAVVNTQSLFILMSKENVFKILWNRFSCFTFGSNTCDLVTVDMSANLHLKTAPSLDYIIEQNRTKIKQKSDMLVLYVNYYLMDNHFLPVKNVENYFEILEEKDSYNFHFVNDPVHLQISISDYNNNTIVYGYCKHPAHKSHTRLDINKFVQIVKDHGIDKYELKQESNFKLKLEQKYEELFQFIIDNAANN